MSSFKADQAQVEVGLINDSAWYFNPRVELFLQKGDQTKKFDLRQAELTLGILPNNQQVFSLAQSNQAEVKQLLSLNWQAQVRAFCQAIDYPQTDCLRLDLVDTSKQSTSAPSSTEQSTSGDSSGFSISWTTIMKYLFPILVTLILGGALIFTLRVLRIWHQKRDAFNPQAEIKSLEKEKEAEIAQIPPPTFAPPVQNKPPTVAKPMPQGVIPDLPSVENELDSESEHPPNPFV